jgi:hypothetical protein
VPAQTKANSSAAGTLALSDPAQGTGGQDIVGVLRSVHSALDSALGDTDVTHIENDDDLRQEHPVQWAAQWLAHAIELLEEGSAALTPAEVERPPYEELRKNLKPVVPHTPHVRLPDAGPK